jgi:predicted secreted Zn-dependent protease
MEMRSSGFALGLVAGCFALALGPWSAAAQDTVLRKTNYYAMTGSSIRDIQESLRQTRPWKEKSERDGSTEWYVGWHASYSASGGTCQCVSFTTTTTITITLPKWIAPTNTPAEVRAAWTKYVAALEAHEAGHADLAISAAAEMHKRIKEIGSDLDCNTLRTTVQNECKAVLDSHRAQERDYDRKTRHGATQGATLRGRFPEGTNAPGRWRRPPESTNSVNRPRRPNQVGNQ